MREESRQAMRLFVKKVKRAQEQSFMKLLQKVGTNGLEVVYDDHGAGEVNNIKRNGPSLEAMEAATLIFRQFVQNNDVVSLQRMAAIVNDPDVSDKWKGEFVKHKAWLNIFYDNTLDVTGIDAPVTRRYVYEVFLYGGLAHSGKGKVEVFEQWQSQPLLFNVLELHFIVTIGHTFYILQHIANMCEEELVAHE